MAIKILKILYNWMKMKWVHHSSDCYCKYLRNNGIAVGGGTHFDAQTCTIDITRPSLVTIGTNCFINKNFTLMTHDYVSNVFVNMGLDFINSSGKVTIGNNVSFGQNVMVLKGVTIGDNCFIGACSLVNKSIPANSIAAGVPCKVIMTIHEYYQRRKSKCESEAIEYAKSIVERFGRKPLVEEFYEEYGLFVNGDDIEKYPSLHLETKKVVRDGRYRNHKAKYDSFELFLKTAAGIQ